MSQPSPNPPARFLLILWGAFILSHGLFLLVGYMLYGQDGGDPESAELMAMVMTGVGLTTALASAVAVPIVVPTANLFTVTILRFALAESVTIYGLVLALMGAQLHWVYILTALGLTAHLAAFPSKRERERYEARSNIGSA